MPSRAGAPFLLLFFKRVEQSKSEKVSMPFRAGAPFLRYETFRDRWRKLCINALSGWGFISTRTEEERKRREETVSMPSRASASFLRDE